MSERTDRSALFRQTTGYEPYDYQRELMSRAAPPDVIEVPTGSGKTLAVLLPWLADPSAPKRLVYALPMRTLVEQTADVVRDALEKTHSDIPVHVLMGGVEPADWRLEPTRRMVIVGTIDMLLSRALNRGFGEGRFAWPVAFGLLNNDCRWVFDEVQLMGPARTTSAQLAGLREKLGVALRCETIWMSATVDHEALKTVDHPSIGDVVRLSDRDRNGPLGQRLNAVKTVVRADLNGVAPADLGKRIADLAIERHVRGERTLIVVNRVETAQAVHAAIRKRVAADGPDVCLVHSRYRPGDRQRQLEAALTRPGPTGTIVVATQVVEAGVDVSSATLITETAPFSSMVQRLGRCNRYGEVEGGATVVWIDRGALDAKAAAPYLPEDLAAAAKAFAGLVGESASPARLETLDVYESRAVDAVLRRVDLLDLFDTAPDISGADVDVSPFIREDDERNVSVFFRDTDGRQRLDQDSPGRDELISIPRDKLGARMRWTFDHIDGTWMRGSERQAIRPGSVVLLDAKEGGYDPLRGWTGAKSDVPDVLTPPGVQAASLGSNVESWNKEWVVLGQHLAEAGAAARDLTAGLPDDQAEAVHTAGALHDIGKAHDAFQEMLLNTIADDGERAARKAQGVWAKSANRGGRHVRPFFRHELVSALALKGLQSDLVRYLVAAHHGRVRMSIRPAPGEAPPDGSVRFALGVRDGDELPATTTPLGDLPACTLDLSEMELGGGWTAAAQGLLDTLGPFRLAYLEALVRIADWRASD